MLTIFTLKESPVASPSKPNVSAILSKAEYVTKDVEHGAMIMWSKIHGMAANMTPAANAVSMIIRKSTLRNASRWSQKDICLSIVCFERKRGMEVSGFLQVEH